MNLGEYLANIILEADDQPEQTIALFPGDFKPPHKGHFEAIEKLLKAADHVVVLVSPKTKDGITADESIAVWELYKPLFDGSVEVKITPSSPMDDVHSVIKDNPDTNFIIASKDSSIEKYSNAKLFNINDVEGSDATNLRMALAQKNEEEIKKYLPEKIDINQFLQALSKQPKEEIPAEAPPPAETPTPEPEQPLQESPPIEFEKDAYQDYILANRRKIEQAAALFNIPISDMEYAFNGGTEIVLNDDMWKEMENTKSYNMKSLEDAISHALKVGINPKPYIDHIKQKKDIPLPLVLQYSQNKYYLVGGEVILSIYKSLGVIPTVLLATLNLQTNTLPEPIHEDLFSDKIQEDIKSDIEHYGMIYEYQINLDDVYEYNKNNNFFSFYDDINNSDVIVKLKKKEDLHEFKFYNVDKEGKFSGFNKLKHYNPKVMNTIAKIFLEDILPNYNKILIQPAGSTRYRLFRALLSNKISKNDFNIQVKDEIDQPYIIISKKEPIHEGIENDNDKKLLKEFIGFAVKRLGIKKLPSGLTLSRNNDDARSMHSFGTFNPNNDHIWLYVKNRNKADIFRTLAHELVHRKQAEDGRIDNNSGETGSEIENEANAMAGVLLREFGKKNENIYEAKKKFGDYLFGDKDSGVKIGWYDSEKEEDTPAEKQLFDYLKKYADSEASTYSTISLDSFIPTFKKIKQQYPEIGDPKISGYIYRGTAIPEGKLRELEAGAKTEPYNQGEIILNKTYSSRRKVSSWSTEYFPAAGFAVTTAERNGGVPVIMRAKASDAELFFNPKFMEKLSTQLEDETFNITNPLPVDIMVIKNYEDEFEDIEASYLHNK
jgi:cytidyltransferase-like protein